MITDKPHTIDTNRQHTQVGWILNESKVQLEMVSRWTTGKLQPGEEATWNGQGGLGSSCCAHSVCPSSAPHKTPSRASPALDPLRQKSSSGYFASLWPTFQSGKRWGLHGHLCLALLLDPSLWPRLRMSLSQAFPARALVTQK